MKRISFVLVFIGLLYTSGCANTYEQGIQKRSDEVVKGCTTSEEKVQALRKYVHNKMLLPESRKKPNGEPLLPKDVYSLNTLERIDSGFGGWCDQQAVVFIRLANKQGIPTRLVWLYQGDDPNSRHTIAEALVNGRWVIVDPMFNLEIRNNDGKIASREDIANNPDIFRNSLSVKQLAKTDNPRWENDNSWLTMFAREKRTIFTDEEAIRQFLPSPNY